MCVGRHNGELRLASCKGQHCEEGSPKSAKKIREANDLVVLQYQNLSISENLPFGIEQMAEHLSTVLHAKPKRRTKLLWPRTSLFEKEYDIEGKISIEP